MKTKLFTALLAMASASMALPQQVVRFRPGQVSPPVLLLRSATVRSDLHLTAAQATKVDEAIPAKGTLIDAGQLEAAYEKIRHLLAPAQVTRLEQIHRQTSGFSTLGYKPYQTSLGASDDQVSQIQTAFVEAMQEYISKKAPAKPDASGRVQISLSQEDRAAIDHIVEEKARKILAAAQLRKWDQMLGVPFKGKVD